MLNMATTFEKVRKRAPNNVQIRLMGYKAFVNLDAPVRKRELSSHVQARIYLGCWERQFRVYEYLSRRMIVTKHVNFNENLYPLTKVNPGREGQPEMSSTDAGIQEHDDVLLVHDNDMINLSDDFHRHGRDGNSELDTIDRPNHHQRSKEVCHINSPGGSKQAGKEVAISRRYPLRKRRKTQRVEESTPQSVHNSEETSDG